MEKEKTDNEFPYESFFQALINKKKREHIHWEYKITARLASEFPLGLDQTKKEKPVNIWCANDSLGISCHPTVMKAVRDAVDLYGVGSGGARLVAGNSAPIVELEKEVAQWHQKEAALLFTSCFVANDSCLLTLGRILPGCHIFSDEENHASLITGISNSRAPKHIFRHNDPAHLAELLASVDKSVPKLVVFETIYSMVGDISPLKELCKVAREHGALTFVDEDHALGMYGHHGAGKGEEAGLLSEMDIIAGSFGKCIGNVGGYIASTTNLVETIRSLAVGFIFTTALPPAVAAGARAAITVLRSDEGRSLRERLHERVKYMKERLQERGIPMEPGCSSHIIAISVGSAVKCKAVAEKLIEEKNHYLRAIIPPGVKPGLEMLRLVTTSHHTKAMIDNFVEDLVEVWTTVGIPFVKG